MTKSVTKIRISGFRSLKEVTLEPGRLTVLIGPNGAGKSNGLTFLQMIPWLHTQRLRYFVGKRGGASRLLHYGPKTTPVLSFRLDFSEEGGESAYEVELEYAAGDTFIFKNEYVCDRWSEAPKEIRLFLGGGHSESKLKEDVRDDGNTTLKSIAWWLSRISFYHFHDTSMTSALRQHAKASDDRILRSDGSNLAAFLMRLSLSTIPEERAAWRRITLLIQKIAPAIRELVPTGIVSEGTPLSVRLDWIDDAGEIFGVDSLSDGTLRAIALVTALAQPASTLPVFMTIDEPELGLHPAALALVAGLARSVSSRCQVLIATQSPTLLDHFTADDVVVVERSAGQSIFRRLDSHALAEWLEAYALSELYDKNILGGRP